MIAPVDDNEDKKVLNVFFLEIQNGREAFKSSLPKKERRWHGMDKAISRRVHEKKNSNVREIKVKGQHYEFNKLKVDRNHTTTQFIPTGEEWSP